MKKIKKIFTLLFVFLFTFSLASCNKGDSAHPKPNPDENTGLKEQYNCITVKEAIEKANEAGDAGTKDAFNIYGKIKQIKNYMYGEMIIEDEGFEIYVWGVRGPNNQDYEKIEDQPKVGDEIVINGRVKTFNGSPEVDKSELIALKHAEVIDEQDDKVYTQMTVSEARKAQDNTAVEVTGIVAKTCVNASHEKDGFYLVDDTGSTFIHGKEVSSQLNEGQKVTIKGEKVRFEANPSSNNEKFNYVGAVQLTNAKLVKKENGPFAYNNSWMKETDLVDLLNRKDYDDITGNIFKTHAYVKESIGDGFTNYFVNDVDGKTGSYVYTKASGADLTDLKKYDDGKLHEVQLSIINYKVSSSGLTPRFIVIDVDEAEYKYDVKNAPKYALDFAVMDQFDDVYYTNPAKELVTTVSNEVLAINNIAVSYESSDANVATIDDVNGKKVLNLHNAGKVNITCKATHGENTLSKVIEITYDKIDIENAIKVKAAIDAEMNSVVKVRGVVISSLVNQKGFLLGDETGVIAVKATEDQLASMQVGQEVYVEGKRGHHFNKGNETHQDVIFDLSVFMNLYGEHATDETSFIKDKTMADVIKLAAAKDTSSTTQVYRVKAFIKYTKGGYSSNYYICDPENHESELMLYCSGASQYDALLENYKNKEVVVDIVLSDYSYKKDGLRGMVIATIDGETRTPNTLNFKK